MSQALQTESDASDPHLAPAHCLNCGSAVSGNYCHHCGQETVLHRASTREFLHEFVGHYVAVEGRLWGTITRLLFRPGLLTLEYIKGRRVRFVQPLRLFLTASLLFFAVLKLTNAFDPAMQDEPVKLDKVNQQVEAIRSEKLHAEEKARAEKKVGDQSKDEAKDQDGITIGNQQIAEWLSFWPTLSHQWIRFEQMPMAQKSKVFVDGFYHYAPYVMVCLMPFFALYLKILYLGSGRRFGEHLLFALHTNAFAFLLLIAISVINIGIVQFALWIWLLGYLPWAMRRVYQGGRFVTGLRWLLLMGLYMVTVLLGFLFTIGAGVLTAGH
jgi:hypothetical protein